MSTFPAHTTHGPLSRRSFFRGGLAGLAAACLPDRLAADPYAPLPPAELPSASAVRIRGRVRARGRGLGGVRVSDGLQVVATARDGTFQLLSTTRQPFVHLTVPAGYRIPRGPRGTARFYAPLTPDSRGEMTVQFELEPLEVSDDRHLLFLLADIQTEDAQEIAYFHEQTVPDLQRAWEEAGRPEAFGVACGDIMFDRLELFDDYEKGVAMTGIPFFQVVGNHDLDGGSFTDEASVATFHRRFGPRYYSFERGAVHYVVLDDVFWHGAGYLGYLDADQLTWLANDLKFVEPGRTVVVAAHIPVLGSRHLRDGQRTPSPTVSVTNRQLLYRLLEPYRAHILVGHTHESEHGFEAGIHEHVCGAVCGAWWSGPICADGTPNGYAVYEARGEELRWRYKATGHPFEHQIRLYPPGSDPTAPTEVVANVWDWDPRWRVVWYEDGERKGEMTRRLGTDPLSERLHRGEDRPPRRPWVDPYPVAHMFYAPVSPGAREVRVEATDRWGRTYSEALGMAP